MNHSFFTRGRQVRPLLLALLSATAAIAQIVAPIEDGGTGAVSAAGARGNLGLGTGTPTGTGVAVRSDSPILVTPNIGAATGVGLFLGNVSTTSYGAVTVATDVTSEVFGINGRHSFEAFSIYNPTTNWPATFNGVAEFDSRGRAIGTMDFAHLVSFQGRLRYSSSGQIYQYLRTLDSNLTIDGGATASKVQQIYLGTPALSNGSTITELRGIVIEDQTPASASALAIETKGSTPSTFGGRVNVGSLRAAGNLSSAEGAGFFSNLYFSGGWKYSGGGTGGVGFYSGSTNATFLVAPTNGGAADAAATPANAFTIHNSTLETTFLGAVKIGAASAAITGVRPSIATLDFGSISAGAIEELTVSVTGATTGQIVGLGLPAAANAGLLFTAYVSAADTVKVRATNITASPVDAASASYRVVVISF